MQRKGIRIEQGEFATFSLLRFRPFREIDVGTNSKSWDRVSKLEHGKVYVEVSRCFSKQKEFLINLYFQGNLANLIDMKHWKGNDVLYIGDHIYGDLAVSD